MRSNRPRVAGLIALAFVFVLTASVGVLAQNQAQKVPNGKSMKIQGIVSKRNADSFRMRDNNNVETVVALTPGTEVKTHRKGAFRGAKTYGVSYILRGLRVEVEGVGNADGQLVAKSVKFDEQDLRTAQALQQTDEMARENQERITAEEENAKKLAGQIAENTELASQAQARADAAQKAADLANKRINGLDDYDPVKTITVLFATGSSVLGPKGKAVIDREAAWVKTQNTKGWVVEVVGFADTTGNTAANRSLSERRANAVIGYLVTKHNLPLQRLVQPFGYGDSKPASDNTTAEGRAKNRRVEIKLLVNKGIAGTTD
ncbi:MAG TPA: OmpA family protein [Blastocatellia bacterium]|nr:OmpA family protein [Blastocatellia bacterium]